MTTKYPQSEKLLEVKDQSQLIGEFLSWLNSEGYEIAEWDENDDELTSEYMPEILYPVSLSIEKLLAKYFDIDLFELENERRQMIEELQQNG